MKIVFWNVDQLPECAPIFTTKEFKDADIFAIGTLSSMDKFSSLPRGKVVHLHSPFFFSTVNVQLLKHIPIFHQSTATSTNVKNKKQEKDTSTLIVFITRPHDYYLPLLEYLVSTMNCRVSFYSNDDEDSSTISLLSTFATFHRFDIHQPNSNSAKPKHVQNITNSSSNHYKSKYDEKSLRYLPVLKCVMAEITRSGSSFVSFGQVSPLVKKVWDFSSNGFKSFSLVISECLKLDLVRLSSISPQKLTLTMKGYCFTLMNTHHDPSGLPNILKDYNDHFHPLILTILSLSRDEFLPNIQDVYTFLRPYMGDSIFSTYIQKAIRSNIIKFANDVADNFDDGKLSIVLKA